jgi:hypothetical protein
MARTYTIRGQNPKGLTHSKIQLSTYDPKMMYRIVNFKIMPAGNAKQFNGYGVLTINKNDALDPTDPDFADNSQIAWAHSAVRMSVPPGVGESITMSYDDARDRDRWFNYDLWLHTQDEAGNEAINWYIEIYKEDVNAVSGSITSLVQQMADQTT